MAYKKVRGDANQVNDIASPHNNFIQIFGDGSGRIVTWACVLLAYAGIGYMFVVYRAIFVFLFFCFVSFIVVIGVSLAWRHVSHTRKEHLVNEEEIKWSKIIYVTENLVATLDRSGTVHIENAQQVSIQQHLPAPQTVVSEWPTNKQQAREAGGDGYSELLGK